METLEQLISKAEAGDVQSCFELGQRFAIGEGTDADESAAFEWYLRAARLGHPGAEFVVGHCYANGIAAAEDPSEAPMWLFRSAIKGGFDAYAALSDYYETHDTPEDGCVYEYFKSRSSPEDPDATYVLARLTELAVGTDFDPVALDRACIDLVQKQPMIPGSLLYANCNGRKPADIFSCVQPSTRWQSTFEHAERMGFGSSDYEIVEVR